ncbi:hypothetical protein SASPL_122850 [Salvia splendens]|uniref:Protein kinase domain-containing protein n=1 Tax=Salvia splendens TaxID=180675 RepID=A0A8X8ZTE5_SALSN|nr:hypothetical protein SASPL_122850 [Salvia splendens]
MGCFLCSRESSISKDTRKTFIDRKINLSERTDHAKNSPDTRNVSSPKVVKEDRPIANPAHVETSTNEADGGSKSSRDGESKARTFTFANLVAATHHFKEENFLGEGGFGRVYKGRLLDTGELVAVKQLDRSGCQGIREFVVEVMTLSMADHPNLVKLIGYCAEGDQRLLVYEYMPLGSLEDHLHGPKLKRKKMDWNIRMNIAAGAAQGLERAIDNRKSGPEANLVSWARPLFKDRKRFHQMADPSLEGQYPVRGLYQALAIAAMCVQEQPNMRPLIADIVTALNYLASQAYDPSVHGVQGPDTPRSRSKGHGELNTDNHSQARGRQKAGTSRAVELPQTSQPRLVPFSSPKGKIEEAANLPLYKRNSSGGKKENLKSRLPEKLVHLIPLVVLLCFFILWCFSYFGKIRRCLLNGMIDMFREKGIL